MVRGYAIGGGNVLNVVCDLTIRPIMLFGQTGPKVGSFDAVWFWLLSKNRWS